MKAEKGDTVRVHYTGKVESGEVFDSSRDRQPLEFTIGSGKVIAGFEKGIIGMEPKDTKTFTVLPEEAYGPKREEFMVVVKTSDFPEEITPSIGQQLQLRNRDGSMTQVFISHIEGDTVTLDANHPLTGETLVFDVELIGIV